MANDRERASRQRYLERIARVRDHIQVHLDDALDLDGLAEVACLSRFHWHRIYRAMMGESAVETVRRLRLARSAADLAEGRLSLERIAERAGYSSKSAFSRAFAAAHGVPPTAFRTAGLHADLARAREEGDPMAFPVEIRSLPARPALGLTHHGAYHEIGRTFDRLHTILGAEGAMGHVRGMFGLYRDDPDAVAPEQLRSQACVFVDDAGLSVPGLDKLTAGGGTYAVLTYRGPYSAMKPAYDWLFGTWLPQSGREARDGAVLEVNLNTPLETEPADLLTEICLPLES